MPTPDDIYAFPIPKLSVWEGMGLRDYFAARAMQGLLANPRGELPEKEVCAIAYEVADLMLAARQSSAG